MSGRATIDVGIDLGTTNSVAAALRGGRPHVLRNNDQSEITPSAVMVERSGAITVGRHAYDQAELRPDRVVREFKRAMGTDKTITVGGQAWTPEQLSAEVLKTIVSDARAALGEEVRAAVITVPAMFTLPATDATSRAATLAGIEEAPLLQEPIAAGIAYGVQGDDVDGYWVVYDFGGGTFDASLMSLKDGRLRVIDHEGDEYLGGRNMDEALIDHVVDGFRAQGSRIDGLVRRDDPRRRGLYARLKQACERARIYLSRQDQISVEAIGATDDDGVSIDAEVLVTRETLEHLIDPHISRTISVIHRLLERNHLATTTVRRILMVGGPTLTPRIRARVPHELGIAAETRVDPMTVVAQGAAIYGGSVLREPSRSVSAPAPARAGEVRLDLRYDPVSELSEALVGGRVREGETDSLTMQVDRADGGWSSGRIAISGGIFTTSVALRPRQANAFLLRAFDGAGRPLVTSPAEITITHGLVVDEPPLSRSLGVAWNDGSPELKTRVMIAHGERLPASGRHVFRTITPLAQGKPDEIKVHFVEGEAERPDRNDHVGYIRLGGEMFRRPLPVGSEVHVTIKVDASRRMRAEAFVPLLDETFGLVVEDLKRPIPQVDVLRAQMGEEEQRLAEIGSVATVGDALSALAEVRRALHEASSGDQDAAMRAQRLLREAQARIDEAAEVAAWPMLEAGWRDVVPKTRDALTTFGDAASRQSFHGLEREGEAALTARNRPLLRQRLDQVQRLYWAALMEQDGWWIGLYQELVERQGEMADAATAQHLIQEGRRALDRQDFEALRKTTRQLWEQIGGSERAGGLPDVGIRA